AILGPRKEILATVVDADEVVIAIENEIEEPRRGVDHPAGPADQAVEDAGCRGDAKIEHRLLAQVEHAVKRVLRWREQASFSPLERALRPVLLPDLGGAPPLQNKRELLVQVVL